MKARGRASSRTQFPPSISCHRLPLRKREGFCLGSNSVPEAWGKGRVSHLKATDCPSDGQGTAFPDESLVLNFYPKWVNPEWGKTEVNRRGHWKSVSRI